MALFRSLAAGLLGLCLLVAAAPERALAESAAELDAKVAAALDALYASEPGTRDLAAQSKAIMVFPEIVKGGVIIGGQYGEGALLIDGATQGYYSIASASFGLQFGGQTYGYAMFILTDAGLQYLKDTKGLELGVGPTIVGGDKGWSNSLGTNDIQGDIAPVFFGQEGVMVGGGIQGSKITPVER
ncbi:MAG: lipid-binding SYLF domain-containing protein [Pseudomonadota bacterium]